MNGTKSATKRRQKAKIAAESGMETTYQAHQPEQASKPDNPLTASMCLIASMALPPATSWRMDPARCFVASTHVDTFVSSSPASVTQFTPTTRPTHNTVNIRSCVLAMRSSGRGMTTGCFFLAVPDFFCNVPQRSTVGAALPASRACARPASPTHLIVRRTRKASLRASESARNTAVIGALENGIRRSYHRILRTAVFLLVRGLQEDLNGSKIDHSNHSIPCGVAGHA